MVKTEYTEQEILTSVENDEWNSIADKANEIDRYTEYAAATFRKDKRVNIRISERDLVNLQKKALNEGLPYQTLISSILHKYITGRLIEKPA